MENEELLLGIMAVFTGVAAVALVIQMAMLIAVARGVRQLHQRVGAFLERWEPVAETANQTLSDVRRQTADIARKVEELTETTRTQVVKVDGLLDDVSAVARVQLERLDRTVETTLDRFHEATENLQRTVAVPLRQARALAAAMGAMVDYLMGRGRPTVDRATLDEEMFI